MLENVRCFARAEVPLDAQVTVIIGQNGSGKTSIAEAIASLAPGEREGLEAFPRRRGTVAGSMAIFADSDHSIAGWSAGEDGGSQATSRGPATSGELRRERLSSSHRVFVYGQHRALRPPVRPRRLPSGLDIFGPGSDLANEQPAPEDLGDALRRPATRTLFDFDEYLFRDLAAYAALLEQRSSVSPSARRVWERLCDWLGRLDGARLGGVEILADGGRRTIALRRGGVALPLGDLSDGYRAMLAVVLDLVIRYALLFDGAEDPLAGAAMVVIDEVDLNLHPRWQRRVIDQLTDLFPGTQFVLTTHSPAIVQAAIDEKDMRVRVLVLDEDAGKQGTTVRALTKGDLRRLDGAEVDSVMVDEAVFGVVSRYSPTYERLEKKAADLRRKLEEGEATAAERRELLGILDELQGLLAREDEREGHGPLLSEIARTQIALLRLLDEQVRVGKPPAGGKPAGEEAGVKKRVTGKETKRVAKARRR